jgi:tRNA modification GTPase
LVAENPGRGPEEKSVTIGFRRRNRMNLSLDDTIAALATVAAPGGRAIVRISGAHTQTVVAAVFTSSQSSQSPLRRCLLPGEIRLPDVHSPLAADLYFWPAPDSYTGQHVAELHTLSSPPLLELVLAELLKAGARASQRGEFTMRAFLAGKLDLTRAEAVLNVIEAGNRDDLKRALAQLAGGLARPLHELRDDLLNLLADVEAGLDFSDEAISFVGQEDLLKRLGKGMAHLTLLRRQLEQRGISSEVFRVVLAGRPNAGKSSLFNALGGASALVSPQPGTTRDYLVQPLAFPGLPPIEVVDTPGWQHRDDVIEAQAQTLGREQADRADLVLLCLEAGLDLLPAEEVLLRQAHPPVLPISTQCDRREPLGQAADWLTTSALTGHGLAELKAALGDQVRQRTQPPLAPSLSRCRHHVETCLAQLRRAHHIVLFGDAPELFALELRGALDQLGEMVGAIYTDDLLDRVFSRFCIGK